MCLTVNLNEKLENEFLESAKKAGMTPEEYLKSIILERLEDEYDAKCADKAYEEYLKNPVTYTHEEIMREFGLKKE